ncbi:universal stress protein [uncultured Meiothermus sp.]|jgi:nucleotide-binding universal stress UspA family protein|uniref:universal stress protein n=1 Tax=uncultured Meiothermus sp. TaxID=157471 RepID=UPI00263339DA|nr:universal stress protein [uncultured Meiothermus sp.]
MRIIRHILVPTNFSVHTEAVLEVVRRRYPQAHIRLLHVGRANHEFNLLMPYSLLGANLQYLPQLAKEIETQERVKLQQLADMLGVQAELQQGDVVEGIVQVARDWKADLIVLHRLEHKVWWARLSPSVSQEVLRRAPADVLVVHLPKRMVDIHVGWAEPEATGLPSNIGWEPTGQLYRR